MSNPIPFPKRICIDFDGVIHSHISPWKGPEIIEDPPVPGAFFAIETYLKAGFRVAIFSCRSSKDGGVRAMMNWFYQHGISAAMVDHLEFPCHKPAAEIYIDDRGFHFEGSFPSVEWIQAFKTWNRQ